MKGRHVAEERAECGQGPQEIVALGQALRGLERFHGLARGRALQHPEQFVAELAVLFRFERQGDADAAPGESGAPPRAKFSPQPAPRASSRSRKTASVWCAPALPASTS